MELKEILHKLNWFYSFELNQVDLYTAQSKRVDDIYLSKVLERTSCIEQQHVDIIANKIKALGGEPLMLGNVLAPIAGKLAGNLTFYSGIANMLKLNIALEKKAMADYKDFIIKAGKYPDLFDLLWANLIDEDLHTSWFSSKVRELERKKITPH